MTAVQGSVSTFVSVKQLDLINETSGHSPAVFVSYKTISRLLSRYININSTWGKERWRNVKCLVVWTEKSQLNNLSVVCFSHVKTEKKTDLQTTLTNKLPLQIQNVCTSSFFFSTRGRTLLFWRSKLSRLTIWLHVSNIDLILTSHSIAGSICSVLNTASSAAAVFTPKANTAACKTNSQTQREPTTSPTDELFPPVCLIKITLSSCWREFLHLQDGAAQWTSSTASGAGRRSTSPSETLKHLKTNRRRTGNQ